MKRGTSNAIAHSPTTAGMAKRNGGKRRRSDGVSLTLIRWWCRLDSNQRQRDYESRALPPELRHRASRARRKRPRRRRSYLAVCARALSLRFLVRRLASATRFLLFTVSPECGGATRSPGSVVGCRMVAEVGFEPTTFGL